MEDTLLQSKDLIKHRRESLGLTQKEFAFLLNLKDSGDRTISGWERGEHSPTDAKLKIIRNLSTLIPFKESSKKPDFTFIDLFAGIGGIRLPFQQLNGKCLFSSEWDKFAIKTYASNYGELPNGDITKIPTSQIPSHDILLAGFPCQAFSQAGLKKGFTDTRGTMFFEIQRILAAKQPKAFLLENVKQLKGHDKGKTLKTILEIFVSVFPQLKHFNIFSRLNTNLKDMLSKVDFIFIISLLIIDETDNVEYFIYKFNLSKKDQKRIRNISDFYKKKITSKTFTEKNLNLIFYHSGKETVLDILNYRILKTNKLDNNILALISKFEIKSVPTMPFKADFLMSKYDIPEGKMLGEKLKLIESKWIENNFQISEQQIENIINN